MQRPSAHRADSVSHAGHLPSAYARSQGLTPVAASLTSIGQSADARSTGQRPYHSRTQAFLEAAQISTLQSSGHCCQADIAALAGHLPSAYARSQGLTPVAAPSLASSQQSSGQSTGQRPYHSKAQALLEAVRAADPRTSQLAWRGPSQQTPNAEVKPDLTQLAEHVSPASHMHHVTCSCQAFASDNSCCHTTLAAPATKAPHLCCLLH